MPRVSQGSGPSGLAAAEEAALRRKEEGEQQRAAAVSHARAGKLVGVEDREKGQVSMEVGGCWERAAGQPRGGSGQHCTASVM